MLIVLTTSPRVAPGLLSRAAWQALESADAVLAPPGHAQLPALDEAGIRYQVVDPGHGAEPIRLLAEAAQKAAQEATGRHGSVVWLPDPGIDAAGLVAELGEARARVMAGSADLPGARLLDLVVTMDRLRVDCPWDARQTHASLAPHLLEEPYEALDALESGDQLAFCEELGDVLLQVAFHARIAAERDDGTGYTIDDVADGIVAKLKRRHPHVFGDVTVSGADEVKVNWDAIKRQEKEEKRAILAERRGLGVTETAPVSALDGVPFGQPALALAAQLLRRAGRAGVPDELASLDGDAGSLAPSGPSGPSDDGPGAEIGRELFRLVAAARAAGRDPELELRAVARRYRDLVRAWERSEN